jgi:hypothetical protein
MPRETFELTREGGPDCSIIITVKPTLAARLAALELQYHILQASGLGNKR